LGSKFKNTTPRQTGSSHVTNTKLCRYRPLVSPIKFTKFEIGRTSGSADIPLCSKGGKFFTPPITQKLRMKCPLFFHKRQGTMRPSDRQSHIEKSRIATELREVKVFDTNPPIVAHVVPPPRRDSKLNISCQRPFGRTNNELCRSSGSVANRRRSFDFGGAWRPPRGGQSPRSKCGA